MRLAVLKSLSGSLELRRKRFNRVARHVHRENTFLPDPLVRYVLGGGADTDRTIPSFFDQDLVDSSFIDSELADLGGPQSPTSDDDTLLDDVLGYDWMGNDMLGEDEDVSVNDMVDDHLDSLLRLADDPGYVPTDPYVQRFTMPRGKAYQRAIDRVRASGSTARTAELPFSAPFRDSDGPRAAFRVPTQVAPLSGSKGRQRESVLCGVYEDGGPCRMGGKLDASGRARRFVDTTARRGAVFPSGPGWAARKRELVTAGYSQEEMDGTYGRFQRASGGIDPSNQRMCRYSEKYDPKKKRYTRQCREDRVWRNARGPVAKFYRSRCTKMCKDREGGAADCKSFCKNLTTLKGSHRRDHGGDRSGYV